MLKFHPLEVAELRVEPEEAVYLSFAVPPALRDEYRFAAGQHIGIRGVLDGEEVRRTYSLVNAPGGDTLQIGVRLHAHGRMSRHLARNVRVGDRLDVLTPNGSFHSRAQSQAPRTVVAFAAGCGITPALSIVRTLLATSTASRVTLFYGNRTTSRIMLLEELQALKDQFVGQLSLQFIFSGEPQDVELFNGRIDATKVKELARVLFDANAVDEFFVCGPGDMNEQVGAALQALGVAAERIHSERFTVTGAATSLPAGAPSTSPAPVALTEVEATAGVTTVSVLMDGRRRSFDMERDGETVLEAAERAGLDLPFSCRAGVCSTCRTKVVKGAVEMAQNYALEPWEVEAGFVLACQSRPTTPQLEVSYDER